MGEYKKKTNTGDDVFIRVQPSICACLPSLNGTHDFSSVHPTAVLLGWLGAKHKNLAKYSSIYEEMGYNIVQVVAPPSVVFALKPRNTAVFVLSLLRIIAADDRLNKGGIVFMMFSNGGAICAPYLARMFAGNYGDIVKADDEQIVKTIKDAMAAVVFDSSPCFMHIMNGARAINEGLRVPEGLFRWLVCLLFAALVSLQSIFVLNLPKCFWNGVRSADFMCPEQYLYSAKDHLLDVDRLEALIEERRQMGREIRAFRVEDAEHVMILRSCREKYTEKIRAVNEWGVNAFRRRRGMNLWNLDETPQA
eukprot:GFKZ01006279.1.p1 GENE.GFKZ01006279.1~~GFKZ01006279.1.p1  ORF type:complete len:307 (-),score=50.68 GFKZ01006279.1:681-1601(-)